MNFPKIPRLQSTALCHQWNWWRGRVSGRDRAERTTPFRQRLSLGHWPLSQLLQAWSVLQALVSKSLSITPCHNESAPFFCLCPTAPKLQCLSTNHPGYLPKEETLTYYPSVVHPSGNLSLDHQTSKAVLCRLLIPAHVTSRTSLRTLTTRPRRKLLPSPTNFL